MDPHQDREGVGALGCPDVDRETVLRQWAGRLEARHELWAAAGLGCRGAGDRRIERTGPTGDGDGRAEPGRRGVANPSEAAHRAPSNTIERAERGRDPAGFHGPNGYHLGLHLPIESEMDQRSTPGPIGARDPRAPSRAIETHEEHQRFRVIFEQSPIPSGLILGEGPIIANLALAELTGYSRDELRALAPVDITHPADHRATRQAREQLLAGDIEVLTYEKRYVRKDGSVFWGRTTLSAVVDDDGEIEGIVAAIVDIGPEREAAAKLVESERRFRAIVENSTDIIAVLEPDGNWSASDAGTRQLGYPKGFDPDGGVFSLVHPDDMAHAADAMSEVLEGLRGPHDPIALRLRDADGDYHFYECVGQNLGDDASIGGVIITARNIDRRRALEVEARAADRRFRAAFEDAPVGMAMIAFDATVLDCNDAFARILGQDRGRIIGQDARRFAHEDARAIVDDLETIADRPGGDEREVVWQRLDGSYVWVQASTQLVVDEQGTPEYALTMALDISERRRLADRLARDATHDALTGLLNRAAFVVRLEGALTRRDARPESTAMLFLDLDRFKLVNDTLGHAAGDLVLIEVANRIRDAVRESDTVARLGGDEFVVLCEGVDDPVNVIAIAERIAEAVEQRITIGEREAFVGASIGIAFAVEGQSASELLRDSDAAQYRAKRDGRSRIERFDEGMRAETAARVQLELDLRAALHDGAVTVEYQPVVSVEDQIVRAFVAEPFWPHPDRGVLAGDDVRTLADECGLGRDLGRHLLALATSHVAGWPSPDPHASRSGDTSVRVIVSPTEHHLADPAIGDDLRAALEASRLDPGSLCIGVSEEWLVDSTAGATEAMRRIRETGAHLALDGFGRAHASLADLREVPVDIVRLDPKFAFGLSVDEAGATIVAAVIALARALDLVVLADGVDEWEHLAALFNLDCDFATGRLIALPVDGDGAAALLGRPAIPPTKVA